MAKYIFKLTAVRSKEGILLLYGFQHFHWGGMSSDIHVRSEI